MTDLGSNFVVHLLLVHMILYLLTLQVHLFLEPLHLYFHLYINVKKPFKITYRRIVKLALNSTSILQITVYNGQPHFFHE